VGEGWLAPGYQSARKTKEAASKRLLNNENLVCTCNANPVSTCIPVIAHVKIVSPTGEPYLKNFEFRNPKYFGPISKMHRNRRFMG
jgi:hypothetical protein